MLQLQLNGGLSGLVAQLGDSGLIIVALVIFSAAVAMLRRRPTTGQARGPGLRTRVGAMIWSAITTNWQLSLLATAAALLSFASGWRTWDGMKNFTGEPVASLLMTFGVQAVMLIIAWLIGESFASGLRTRRRTAATGAWGHYEPAVGGIVGMLCAIGLAAAIANSWGVFGQSGGPDGRSAGWLAFADKSLYVGVGLLALATLLINHRSDVVQPYVQSARLIAKNAILWVMLLLCMATATFFSFDSFFNSIFPQSERARSAEIRSQRQVAGVVNDIGALVSRRQTEESEQLFQSPGWQAYEKQLSALAQASLGAEQVIERYFVDQMEAHKSAMAAQQERMATARSGQAGIVARKNVLVDELTRLKAERPALAGELAEKKSELDTRSRGVDAKRVEMMAEERGAEGTLKVGKGPIYRQRQAELQQLQDAYKIQEQRVGDAQKRLETLDRRVAQIEREIAAVDGDLAKLRGEADTAAQRIAAAESSKGGAAQAPRVDPARVRSAFERSVNQFRQEPTVEHLDALTSQCAQLLGAMTAAPATRDRVRGIDCDPKPATEAAARVFALNAGLLSFTRSCAGGDKLPTSGGTDALLEFGRRCLQDSGLPTADSSEMAARLSSIDLNRDDKAHRFVVTWNAFLDGNRLAYLALAIAIALESLVFMSGLFGANAVRSPLTEVEHNSEMSADQLNATIDATLGQTVDPAAVLSALLGALQPIRNVDGFSSEIVLDEQEPLLDEMRKVLNAGSNISAVHPVDGQPSRYRLHSGLVRYLTLAQRKPWKAKPAALNQRQLVNVIGVALLPEPQANADLVLSEMHPVSDSEGFAAETYPFRIPDEAKKRLVLNTLGAGATVSGAVRRENENGRYFVSTDFYKTLLLMRAGAVTAFRSDVVRARFGHPTLRDDGSLPHDQPLALMSNDAPRIEARTARGPSGAEPRHQQPIPLQTNAANSDEPRPPPRKPGASRLAGDIRKKVISGALQRWGTWGDDEIEAIWQTRPEPVAAALRSLVERRGPVGAGIQQLAGEIEQNIDDTYLQLQRSGVGDVQVLESEVDNVRRMLPVLIMTADGPYHQMIDEMIRELKDRGATLEDQAGSSRLSENEIARFHILDEHLRRFMALEGAFNRDEAIVELVSELREGEQAGSSVAPDRGAPMS
ncbi:MAG: hypothetical protein AB7L90_09995 [Hyphomicrobiaceae bacterium]